MTHYYLYLDESGNFEEHSLPGDESKGFASQLVGFLVERDPLPAANPAPPHAEIERQAEGLMRDAYIGAPQGLAGQHHMNRLMREQEWSSEQYNVLVRQLLREMRRRTGWQPVRLVNVERIGFDNRIQTYTRMIAELAVRVCQQKKAEGVKHVALTLVCANYKIGGTDDAPDLLEPECYQAQIEEAFLLARVRHGCDDDWTLKDLLRASGRSTRSLQICDTLSHSSHANFRNCSKETRAALREAFGKYDFRMVLPALLSRVEQLVTDGSLGQAIIPLVERLSHKDETDLLRGKAQARLDEILNLLVEKGASARDAQLSVLVAWLEQIIDQQRVPGVGYEKAAWLKKHVAARLKEKIEKKGDARSLDWFEWGIGLWALTASNHLGHLANARSEVEAMGTRLEIPATAQTLLSSLAGKWEHAPLLLQGLVATAVHRTDCFEHDAASLLMEQVAACYGDLGNAFRKAYPVVFTQRIRSDWRGRALGTWLQNETFAGLVSPERLTKARELSQLAIDEFTAPADRERQFQYRSHLEAAAGEFQTARKYLALSLRLPDDASHGAIAAAIAGLALESPVAQRFALLHWLRVGAACMMKRSSEANDIYEAAAKHGFLEKPWGAGTATDYPVHGILRRVAWILVFRGQRKRADEVLEYLSQLDPIGKDQVVLGTVQLAACAEVTRRCWLESIEDARKWLGRIGTDLKTVRTKTETAFPRIWALFADWPDIIASLMVEPVPSNAPELLDRLAQRAGQIPF